MPSLSNVRTILNQLILDVKAAWPDVEKVYVGKPRTDQLPLTYAVVILNPEQGDWGSAQALEWDLKFDIFKVQPVPADKQAVLIFQKMDQHDALASVIEGGDPTYAGVGMYPVLSGFDLGEQGDEEEDVMEQSSTFSVRTHASWGE